MLNKNGSYNFKADVFFPWLLFVTFASAITLTWCQTGVLKSIESWKLFQFRSMINYLAAGLTFWTILTLLWRIWFACRYRSYAPSPDSTLPTITVVIPAFNEGRQVLDTVRSVMNSQYPMKKMQVICVDDGSQDDTWRWMQTARQEFPLRIMLIRQPYNQGKRRALMTGFAKAKGQVYVTIDSDSEVLPDTLRHLVSPLASDSRVGAVAGNVRVLNLDEGAIPKMMEVSFTSGFDFIRSGQSVYGGVFCTPGALSAYRADVITPHLHDWIEQTFMGRHATIGEDRALTNLVLGCGFRVVYQRKAVVLTKVPVTYTGLRKMLLRWARSNVRENLVMLSFITRRFRPFDDGSGWVRLFSTTQLVRMTMGEAFKFVVIAQLLLAPVHTLFLLTVSCIISACLPALVHQKRYGGWFGWRWAVPYAFYWLFSLCWISLWGLLTASHSGWLTRELPSMALPSKLPTALPTTGTSRVLSKAA